MKKLEPLGAGDLHDQIMIQAPQYASDGGGGQTLTGWSTIATPWAKVEPISGGETFKFGVERASQFYRIRFRFRTGITTACRVVLPGGALLNIRACEDPNRDREQLEIMAESAAADG